MTSGRGIFALGVSLAVCGLAASARAQAPSSRPADPGSYGAVQEALQLLYVMPHPSARAGDMLRDRKAAAPKQAKPVAGRRLSEEDRRALAHAGLLPAEGDQAAAPPDSQPSGAGVPVEYPLSPWIDRGPRVPDHRRDYANRRYFGGVPGRYGYGPLNPYAGDDYEGDWYRFGFMQGYDRARFVQESEDRTDIVLKHFQGHLANGLTLFNRGLYREAADAFRLAANANHGDPASRLYTAHALFALGRYQEAIPYLRRAYELQPQITYITFDLRDDYGNKADFDEHLKALEDALAQSPQNVDRLILLGYVRYYTNQREGAYDVLSVAWQLDRGNPLVVRLLENARPADVVLERRAAGR